MTTLRSIKYILSILGLTMSPIVSAHENVSSGGVPTTAGLSEAHATGTLFLKTSIPGRPAAGMTISPNGSWQLDRTSAFDLDDDGVADRPFLQFEEDAPNRLAALVVFDGANADRRWTVSLLEPEGIFYFSRPARSMEAEAMTSPSDISADHRDGPVFVSFAEFDRTNDLKEIVMAEKRGGHLYNPLIVDGDGKLVGSITDGTSNTVLLGIADVDGDGSVELIVFNPSLVQVEVWGVE